MSPAALEKMEDAKPSEAASANNSQPDSAAATNGMSLDENTCTQAMKLFKETKHLLQTNVSSFGNGTLDEAERFWFAFVLFSIKRLSEKNGDSEQQGSGDNGYTLCQILRAAKLNIVDFFKELPQFVVKAGPTLSNVYGADWENRLEVLKRAILEFFLTTEANVDKQSAVASSSGYVSDYSRFGWLLFLALCVHAFGHFKDLVTCMNGLVSILAIFIIHVPVCFRNFKFDDCQLFYGSTYFENLLEDSSLSSSLGILEKDYEGAIRSKGELDERVFINDEDSILGSGSLSGGSVNISGVKHSPASHADGNIGGSNSKMVAMPVRTAMTTAKWLCTVISPLPSKP
ncbi:hypothetical protein SO802_008746 [Lithocarpus litseifolius]|uniref:Retinoblastoma-associated protein N-terminal domain-containing protein n=1 Tax=Lithocarpus litseifolius TaxID=425828 RepID=A0AAW2DAI4_9ROSI